MGKQCCGPSRCCTCDEPQSMDACMCGFAYLNGPWPILFGQFFSLLAGMLAVGALVDCSFATIDDTTLDLGDGLEIQASGVGFLFVQNSDDGYCYWYNYAADIEKLKTYWGILGYSWEIAAILTWSCAAASWLVFLYSMSFYCSSQIQQVRYLIGFVIAGIMFVCQACTFIVYAETFCRQNNCSFSRGSAVSLASMVCYFVAGLGFFNTKNYPGETILHKLQDSDEEAQTGNDMLRRQPERQHMERHKDETEPIP